MKVEVVEPVDAATVVLVREVDSGANPWECYMVRRPARSEFAADVYVFPGGKVDGADYNAIGTAVRPSDRPHGIDEPGWTALKIAAIRELFEEVGILLAHETGGRAVCDDVERFQKFRGPVEAGEISLAELARAENLTYATHSLHPFSHWVTPVNFPRRYDTWFFVARLPPGQVPTPHVSETTDALWISPQRALERFRTGTFPLVFATEKHLERLSDYASVEHMLASIAAAQLEAVVPKVVDGDGQNRFLLPGDPGY